MVRSLARKDTFLLLFRLSGARPATSQHALGVELDSVHGHHRRHHQHGRDSGGVHQQGGWAAGGERRWVQLWSWQSWCWRRPPSHSPPAPPSSGGKGEGEIGLVIRGEQSCRSASSCAKDGGWGGLHCVRQGGPAQPGHRGGGGELRVPGRSKLPTTATSSSFSRAAGSNRMWGGSYSRGQFLRWQPLIFAQSPSPPGERPVILARWPLWLIWVDFVCLLWYRYFVTFLQSADPAK